MVCFVGPAESSSRRSSGSGRRLCSYRSLGHRLRATRPTRRAPPLHVRGRSLRGLALGDASVPLGPTPRSAPLPRPLGGPLRGGLLLKEGEAG